MKPLKHTWRGLFLFIFLFTGTSGAICEPSVTWPRLMEGLYEGFPRMIYSGAGDYTAPAPGDLDGDGDLDLLIGHNSGYPRFIRNDGTNFIPYWSFVSGSYEIPPLSAPPSRTAPLLADPDHDDDLDLVLGLANGYIAYYRNQGTQTTPTWLLISENWTGHFAGKNARPFLTDIDADGDLDLFVGTESGQISFYRNEAEPGQDPVWSWQLDNFMNIDVGADASPCFTDINGDGLTDLFVGNALGEIGYFKAYGEPDTLFYTLVTDHFQNIEAPKHAAPAFCDIDHNGTQDLMVGSFAGSIQIFTNYGAVSSPVYGRPSPVWFGLDLGSESAPEPADIDGDGDTELFAASFNSSLPNEWGLRFYTNRGTPWLPDWHWETDFFIPSFKEYSAPRFTDIDADGDLDLFIGNSQGGVIFYRNNGTPYSPSFLPEPAGDIISPGQWAKPAFGDMDHDLDYDLYIAFTDFLGGHIYYYENLGDAYSFSWALPIDCTSFFNPGLLPAIDVGDLNTDGVNDLVCASGSGSVNLFYGQSPPSPLSFSAPIAFDTQGSEPHPVPCISDLNGDLRPDILLGGSYGGIRAFLNPIKNVPVEPHHATVLTSSSLQLSTPFAFPGTWEFIRNESGAFLNSSTGEYIAGNTSGRDIIRVKDDFTSWGISCINVISAKQVSAAGKALLMAGRKKNDPLWKTTNKLAHQVYRNLLFLGFSKENILYLNPEVFQDVDGNGDFEDDIDASSNLTHLQEGLTAFSAGSPNLLIYLIDHGHASPDGRSGFIRCNEEEALYASYLDDLLDDLQQEDEVTTITLIVDCCMAESFLRECSGKKRIVISSTDLTQPAFFSAGGLISFSHWFMSSLYTGHTVGEAFLLAAGAMDRFQKPRLDDDGNGYYIPGEDGKIADHTEIGGFLIAGADRPQIDLISPNQMLEDGKTSATLWAAGIIGSYPLESVWGCITPPEPPSSWEAAPLEPVQNLGILDFAWNPAQTRYEATTDTFTQPGIYSVNIYAQDIWGSVSHPKQMHINQFSMKEEMIILCGDGDYNADTPWEWSESLSRQVYQTARSRWLSDDNIHYLSSSSDPGVDLPPGKQSLLDSIGEAGEATKLFVYMIGKGNHTGLDVDGDGEDADDITPGELDAALDSLQSAHSLVVIVILDFVESGAWLSSLKAPEGKERIVISSCADGEYSYCLGGGLISFSGFFFGKIFNGSNMGDAFNWSRTAIRMITDRCQNPQLDDNGSGACDHEDGSLLVKTWLGAGNVIQNNVPIIKDFAQNTILRSPKALLWASGVWDADGIKEVFAFVTHSIPKTGNPNMEKVPLHYNEESGRWENDYTGFDPEKGYIIIYMARDKKGFLSEPYQTMFLAEDGEDLYDLFYRDDLATSTLNFFSDDNFSQIHNFRKPGDADWAVFNADPGRSYFIQAIDQGPRCDAALTLFHESDPDHPLLFQDDWGCGGQDELISWFSGSTSGTLFVKVTQSLLSPGINGEGTTYTLTIGGEWGPNAGLATISGTQACIGPEGGILQVGSTGIYTKPQKNIPSGALSDTIEFVIDDPGDIGNNPYFEFTKAWLYAHPGNASIVQILTRSPVNFEYPATLTLQFIDDGPSQDEFTIDDLPEGMNPSQMRIHAWNGSQWALVSGNHMLQGDTVSITIENLGTGLFAVAPLQINPTSWILY